MKFVRTKIFLFENMNNYNYVLEDASFHGYLELVKYAIESGADIGFNDNYALTVSAGRGFLEIVQYLAEKGADIHFDNDEVLRVASQMGNFQICDYLVSQGCDPQKVVDDIAGVNKQWAIDFVKARDMNNKLDNELAKKPTKAQKLSDAIETEDFAYKTPTTRTSRAKL
ncbi:ankyrin repeat domain-containing protein [Burkholderia cenocepacia]|uniref:ankyrin repeat domain-containing protein n=1 Tax=Burkholderia cenocepacia TaxID=95486 RepID=UPI002237BF2C|nr:ankyrin repeat domain-containing protein [Burkholderia cenocepacia]MCW5156355.1 ankyrin repeat domain-containing protein [Burkholderia cenocepacia]